MRYGLKIGGGLIALYLGVRYWKGLSSAITSGAQGTGTVVRAFQGR